MEQIKQNVQDFIGDISASIHEKLQEILLEENENNNIKDYYRLCISKKVLQIEDEKALNFLWSLTNSMLKKIEERKSVYKNTMDNMGDIDPRE